MKENLYAVDYIRRAIANDTLEEPNRIKGGRYIEALESLYEVHSIGGAKMALITWNSTLRTAYRELSTVFDTMRYTYLDHQLASIPTAAYYLDNFAIYEGGFNVLVGPRGIGKSFVALHIAKTIAKTDKVVYIAAEGAETMKSRRAAWHTKYGDEGRKNFLLHGNAVNTVDNVKFTDFIRYIVEPWGATFMVIDTVARCMVGMDENNSTDMKAFVDQWDKLRERGYGLLFIHHTNRRGFMRGSGVLDDAADSVLVISKPTPNGLSLRNDFEAGGKNRASKEANPLYFQIVPQIVDGYPDDDPPGVIQPVKRETVYLNEVGEELSTSQRDILSAISDAGSLSVKEIEDATKMPNRTIYSVLKGLLNDECVKKDSTSYSITDKGKRLLDLEQPSE